MIIHVRNNAMREKAIKYSGYFLVAIVLMGVLMLQGRYSYNFNLSEDGISIYGASCNTIVKPDEIADVAYREAFDIGEPVSGNNSFGMAYGTYSNDEYASYELCIKSRINGVVIVTKTDSSVFIFNYESEETTKNLPTLISQYLESLND